MKFKKKIWKKKKVIKVTRASRDANSAALCHLWIKIECKQAKNTRHISVQAEYVGMSERDVPKAIVGRHMFMTVRTRTQARTHSHNITVEDVGSVWVEAMKWQCETPIAQPCIKRFDGASVWRAQKQQAEPE